MKLKPLLQTLRQLALNLGALGTTILLIQIAQNLWNDSEATQYVPPAQPCPLRLTSGSPRPPARSCELGKLIGQDTGETRWQVSVRPALDRSNVIELSNAIRRDQGRYEIQCETQQISLLATKPRGAAAYSRILLPFQTPLERLPQEYERQLLKLCSANPKANQQQHK